jgi:MinD superfamily P-loop ATPase
MFSIPVSTPSSTVFTTETLPNTCGTCKYNNPCETINDVTKVQGKQCFSTAPRQRYAAVSQTLF